MRFRVNGLPAPQGSKRHVGGGRMVESSRAVGPWREAVRAQAQRASMAQIRSAPDEFRAFSHAGLSVTIVFVLPRPKSHYSMRSRAKLGAHLTNVQTSLLLPSAPKYPAKRPDLDKLARAVLDGLVMGGVMADDAQVVSLNACKMFARDGEVPGAVIDVEAMT